MGWWSATILGGDEPLDNLGDLADAAGASSDKKSSNNQSLYGYDFQKEWVDKKLIQMLKVANRSGDNAFQVLGIIIMHCGANMDDQLKEKIHQATLRHEWYVSGDPDRVMYITDFLNVLSQYSGNPVQLKTEGLFEKIIQNKI